MEQEHKQEKKQSPQTQSEVEKEKEEHIEQEQIPDHFYDSDLASINQKDFLSDNQPPKDTIQQRKLLYKEKLLHVHKTIIRLGTNIDKPARFDRISLRVKEVPNSQIVPYPIKKDQQSQYVHPQYFNTFFLMNQSPIEYNLGKDHQDIQRLVTSMKRGEAAVFELEHLQTNKKNNIKKRIKVEVFVIWVDTWTTVIDIDCDGKFMKEMVRRGQGHSRIAKYDEVNFQFKLSQGDHVIIDKLYKEPVKLQEEYLNSMPNLLWKLLYSMKLKQKIRVEITDQVMRETEDEKYEKLLKDVNKNSDEKWLVQLQILLLHSIDDIFLDGRVLKKILTKGVSTAKPDSSSLCYYALRIYGIKGEILHEDKCWNSDWWQDLGKLDELGCRKSYLDDHSVSMLMKIAIKRMKPAQIAQIQCRDKKLFEYGVDFEEFKLYNKVQEIPERFTIGIRLYNFGEGKNCFNMELEEKVEQAKRKKQIGIKYLKKGDIPKALKKFEQIISFFSAGNINQQAYDQKISALMNCTLCHMKNQNYVEMIKLCDQILEKPKHGYDPNKMKIKGPGHAKIQGKIPEAHDSDDEREHAEMVQNGKILDKCLYRKAVALIKTGQGAKALECLEKIADKNEEVTALLKQAEKLKENYQKKSAKMFKNMFG